MFNNNKNSNSLADFFVPVFEDLIETGENGEEFIVKELRIPPGFFVFLVVMLVWILK